MWRNEVVLAVTPPPLWFAHPVLPLHGGMTKQYLVTFIVKSDYRQIYWLFLLFWRLTWKHVLFGRFGSEWCFELIPGIKALTGGQGSQSGPIWSEQRRTAHAQHSRRSHSMILKWKCFILLHISILPLWNNNPLPSRTSTPSLGQK